MTARNRLPDWLDDLLQQVLAMIDNLLQEAEEEGVFGPVRRAIYDHLRINWGGADLSEDE